MKRQRQSSDRSSESLIMKVFIWQKQTFNLFDFQSTHVDQHTFLLSSGHRLVKNPLNSVISPQSQKQAALNSLKWADLIQEQGRLCLHFERANNQTFEVIKSTKSVKSGHKLKLGDRIKMGRTQFEVIELFNGETLQKLQIQQKIIPQKQSDEKEGLQCSFCFLDTLSEDNPFVFPCGCKGSNGIVHLDCLKGWINSRIEKTEGTQVNRFLKTKVMCHVCGNCYPQNISVKGRIISLLTIQRPQIPYIILHSESALEKLPYLYVVTHKLDTVKFGRSAMSDIRIQDISVSRTHAQLWHDHDFYISDCDSKFGTLVSVQDKIVIQQGVSLQVDRTVVSFSWESNPPNKRNKTSHKSSKKDQIIE